MYVIMTQIVYTYYVVHIRKMCSIQIHRTVCMAPNNPDLNPIDYVVY